MSAGLIVAGALVCAVSGLPALLAPRGSRAGSLLSMILLLGGALAGLAGAALGIVGATATIAAPWPIPGGELRIRVDALSAFFAVPVFLLAGAAALYVEGYWPAEKSRAGYIRFFFGVLAGALAIVMVAHNTILFLAAWEIVAISSYFCVAADDDDPEIRAAAWLYLIASHIATLLLFAMVAVLHGVTHTWTFAMLPGGTGAAGTAIFLLALAGFGIKAGIMPAHVWLPGAHAGAPSHVSAFMSGVVIKMGIYGIVRVLTLFPNAPDWFGGTLLTLGIVSSVLGVAFALAQHDLKRLLAYHSVENIGIIVAGLGIGVVARAHGLPVIAFLGYAGALLHVWNHGLFKALLFFGAGSAIHGSGTRQIDRMGGLAKRMPWTAAAFLTGAVAICGLPPLNGFISEWLLYVASFNGVLRVAGGWTWLVLIVVAPALALTGALALACFVKAFGVVFLGAARTESAERAHESPLTMRAAMLPLALACVAIGVAPLAFVPLLDRAAKAASALDATVAASVSPLQTALVALATVLVIGIAGMRWLGRGARRAPTWDCGYAAPTARMQYTSSSFARGLIAFFAWAMPPIEHRPRRLALFPSEAVLETHVPDTVLDRMLLPLAMRVRTLLGFARHLQSGRMQTYLIYIGVTVVVLLIWSVT